MQTTPMLPPRTDALSADGLRAYLEDSWRLSDELFGALTSNEAFALQPDPLRNPLIFYYGHTAAFYVNKLVMAGLLDAQQDERLDPLFARGVDPHAADELDTGVNWPSVAAARAYREAIKGRLLDFIDGHAWEGRRIGWDDPEWALLMGLEHDRIHFETSTMLFRQVPLKHLRRPDGWTYAPTDVEAPVTEVLRVGAGEAILGRPQGVTLYGWDNEFGHRTDTVQAFEGTRDLVTNARFLEFIQDGGYERPELWHPAARPWLDTLERRHPLFWRSDAQAPSDFVYRAMFDELPLPLAWPVEVCCFEAQAFARWAGDGWRLPTEGEHTLLTAGSPEVDGDVFGSTAYNHNVKFGSPTPVGFCAEATSAAGFTDARGNVWEHLCDHYRPFDGFRPHAYYDDFSNIYFDDHHALMAGGAWASTGTSASKWYRNWFRRHFYQHAGFRLVRSV